MSKRNILVTGATGKQGRALIRALLHSSSSAEQNYHIYALTRTASSPSAKSLRETEREENLTLVEGNLDDEASIRKIFKDAEERGGIWGVFAVLAFPGLGVEADGEERQGKLIADLALEFGVKSFLYSSAMRAGPKYEDELKLSGRAKANIEMHCMKLGLLGLPWTILRPSFFMENFEGFIGSISVAVMKSGLKPDTSTALINHEKYKHKILTLASEFSTMTQLEESHQKALGKPIPAVPAAFGWLLVKMNKATRGLITDIEKHHYAYVAGEYPSCDSEIALANSAYKMKTYFEWKSQERKERKEERKEDTSGAGNWNQVSLGKLLTGRM
ncbi:hypothetical protein G7Y89_g13085 [Cudoniella acicularis]|uniref:NmrA-like domain-containing protein n=1 Tax=Cudoniella acicularis TaxID=354080 RepID=A0A8H4R7J6_9HELO|nr:hypothetical protein G7Y89_g13085 [Cudoniella acicularis]